MIRILIALLMSLISIVINAQNKKTQKITGNVTSINVSMPVKVYVDATKDSNQIEIVTDQGVDTDIISVSQVGSKLVVDMKNMKSLKKKTTLLKNLEVHLSQKGIVNYAVEAAGSIYVNGRVKGEVVNINLDSSGYLNADFSVTTVYINVDSAAKYVGNISAKTVKANIDSAAKATVSGDVESLIVNVDSAGSFEGKSLRAKHVKAEVDSMGKADVYPTESLNAYADSMGKIIYHNTPKEIKKYTDSMGSVKAK